METDLELAEAFASLARSLYVESVGVIAGRVARAAMTLIPGGEEATVCVLDRHGGVVRAAATGEAAALADDVWHQAGDGPCLGAIRGGTPARIADLLRDPDGPEAAGRAARASGLRCVLALPLAADGETTGALTVSARSPEAFGPPAMIAGRILATHAALALACAGARRRSRELAEALEYGRVIGMALGIVMARRPQTSEQAFALLRRWSQRDNRKIRDVAEEIVTTGLLPETPGPPPAS